MQANKTVEALQLELSKPNAAYATLQQELSTVLAVNESLVKEIEKLHKEQQMCNCGKKGKTLSVSLTSTELASYTFTLGGQKYGFNFFKLQLNGQIISAVDVVASHDLQQALVSSSSGMIKKIN